MTRVLSLFRRLFRTDTPAELDMAERGAADAYRDVFDPPIRSGARAAYERGWWDVSGQW